MAFLSAYKSMHPAITIIPKLFPTSPLLWKSVKMITDVIEIDAGAIVFRMKK